MISKKYKLINEGNIFILYSLIILALGFATQIYIKNYYGLEILGISILIRMLNSDSFLVLFDFGISEEMLFEKEINFKSFFLRILLSIILLFFFCSYIHLIHKSLEKYSYYLFSLMCTNLMLSINKLYFKKTNNIKIIRYIDIILSIIFLLIFFFTTNFQTVIIILTLLNLCLFLLTFKFDFLLVFNLTNKPFKFYNTIVYYLSSLSAKLEGALLSLIIPSFLSLDVLGLYDLVTKIPKAFKSQLGEFNSIKKYKFLYNPSSENINSEPKIQNIFILVISLLTLFFNLIYLSYLNVNISSIIIFVIISELLIGFIFYYFNIRFLKMFLNSETRFKFVSLSIFRSLFFFIIIYYLTYFQTFQKLMLVWYFLYFIYFCCIYSIYKRNINI